MKLDKIENKRLMKERMELNQKLTMINDWTVRLSTTLVVLSWLISMQTNNTTFASSILSNIPDFWMKGITETPEIGFGLNIISQLTSVIIGIFMKILMSFIYFAILYYIPSGARLGILFFTIFIPFWKSITRLFGYYATSYLFYYILSYYIIQLKISKNWKIVVHSVLSVIIILCSIYSGYCAAMTDPLFTGATTSWFDDLYEIVSFK